MNALIQGSFASSYTFTQGGAEVSITPDSSPGPANHLSSFTVAEALKRIVLHREEAEQRLPGIQWADIKTLLYGAADSDKYGPWGGMTRDTAIYLQSGHDIDYIDARSRGQWSIFSKLGLGSGGHLLGLGGVHDGHHGVAAGGFNLGERGLGLRLINVPDNHFRALGRKAQRRYPANAAGPARDDDYFILCSFHADS